MSVLVMLAALAAAIGAIIAAVIAAWLPNVPDDKDREER